MIASGGIEIHLLDQGKIRVIGSSQCSGTLNGFQYTFFALCPGRFSAIHEKAEIRRIGSKADVVGQCGIFFSGLQLFFCAFRIIRSYSGGLFHCQFQVIFNPVIACKKVNDINPKYNDQSSGNSGTDLQ